MGYKKTPFRIRLYKRNNDTIGEEITTSTIVVRARRKDQWLDIMVKDKILVFPKEGAYISVDWFTPYNERFSYSRQLIKDSLNSDTVRAYYGNSLGLVGASEPNLLIRTNNELWRKYTMKPGFKYENYKSMIRLILEL